MTIKNALHDLRLNHLSQHYLVNDKLLPLLDGKRLLDINA